MRVVVTGSTGAVGRRVCARLAATGHDVLGLDRRSSVPPAPGVEIRLVDLAVADLRNLLVEADTVVHLASGVTAADLGVNTGHDRLAVMERLLAAAADVGVEHLVVRSSAMVYGAWPDNPVPLTEDAPVRPCPDFLFAVHRARLEEMATAWADGGGQGSGAGSSGSRILTVLRPAVTVAEERPGGLASVVGAAASIRSDEGEPLGQFLHSDDLADAAVCAVEARHNGPLNVAPDGWIGVDVMAELGGPGPRLRLPGRLAVLVGRVLFAVGLSPAPPGVFPYSVHPWVVSNDRLRDLGWEPSHSNEEAYVAGHEPGILDRMDARARQQASLVGAGILAVGLVWLLVRLVRGRPVDRRR
ncbi:NAD-dependent epimerase/dehydratase family protein [bacterium]|nr:NAD-dependent epimerase/dehydratase family protein [bacterium]